MSSSSPPPLPGRPSKHWQSMSDAEQAARKVEILTSWNEHKSIRAVTYETGAGNLFVKKCLAEAGADWRQGETADVEAVKAVVAVAPAVEEVAAPQPLPQPEPEPDADPAVIPPKSYKESGDTAFVEGYSDRPLKTVEDVIAFAEVDTLVWAVKDFECTSWQVGMKLRNFDDKGRVTHEAPHVRNLWRIRVSFTRIRPKPLQDAIDAIFERMKGYEPKYPPLKPRRAPLDPHLLELGLFDVHFGKLAWARETGENYDLKIAETVFKNAVVDLLDRVAGYEVELVSFALGNDFLHIDNLKNETTNGTRVDTDQRYEKIFEVGFASVIWALETAMRIAPVKVILVRGNHDFTTAYHLAQAAAVWFRNAPGIEVDYSPGTRKYLRYGECLLGYTHGNEEKVSSLPNLMAQEAREDWGKVRHCEWRRGHFHQSKVHMTNPTDTVDGVTIRTLRSLSAKDAWHARKGFGGPRSAEAYLMHATHGYTGHFVVNARE